MAMRTMIKRSVHNLPSVPYVSTGLLPVISPEAMDFHYNKHHQTYCTNTNNLIKDNQALSALSVEDLVKKAHENGDMGLFNNSAQLWNHSFFWSCMADDKDRTSIEQVPELKTKIESDIAPFETFQQQFTQQATTNFGSGWTWLVLNQQTQKLEIVNTSNAGTPLTESHLKPLLTLDVWEHAYYIDHRNRRPEYIGKWWDVVDWGFVAANLK